MSAGDRVLTTDQEHYGAVNVWHYHANVTGVAVDSVAIPLFNVTASAVLKAFEPHITVAIS